MMTLSGNKRVSLRTFILTQRDKDVNSCEQLANRLGMKVSAVKQRIKYLIKKGYANKLKPYTDLYGSRGRKSIDSKMFAFDDYVAPVNIETKIIDEAEAKLIEALDNADNDPEANATELLDDAELTTIES